MGSSAAYFGLGAPRGANAGQRAESDSGQKAAAGEIARNIRPGDPTGGTTTGEEVGGGIAGGAADGGGLVDHQAALGVEQRTGDPDGKERRRKPRRRSEVAAEGIGPLPRLEARDTEAFGAAIGALDLYPGNAAVGLPQPSTKSASTRIIRCCSCPARGGTVAECTMSTHTLLTPGAGSPAWTATFSRQGGRLLASEIDAL